MIGRILHTANEFGVDATLRLVIPSGALWANAQTLKQRAKMSGPTTPTTAFITVVKPDSTKT